jgi:hypothetical protein
MKNRHDKSTQDFINQRREALKQAAKDINELVTDQEVDKVIEQMDTDAIVMPEYDEPIVVGILPIELDGFGFVPVKVYSDCTQELPEESGAVGLCQIFPTIPQLEAWAKRFYLPGIWVYDHDKGLPRCLRTGAYLPQAKRYVKSA